MQPGGGIRKMIESPERLVVSTASPRLARHALNTMVVAIWICDIALPANELKSLVAIAKNSSAGIQIVFLGTQLMAAKAKGYIEAGLGVGFIARPFAPVDVKKAVADAATAYYSRKNGAVTAGQAGKTASQSTKLGGPDPEHYTLLDLIAVGGTGMVFNAYDKFLNLDVAVKIINRDILADEGVLAAFKDEARIAMQLSHRGIVRMYGFNTYNDCYYIVMELVRGMTLRDVILDNGCLSIDTTCQILVACSDALEYAHKNNVIHNDIKPENIFITDAHEVKIIDFGTATLKNRAQAMSHIVGTPEYMSPEQIRCEVPDPTNDIYALGILTYLMLVGRFPFPPEATSDVLLQGVRPEFSGVSLPLATVLSYATAPEAASRYQSVPEFVSAVLAAFGIPEGTFKPTDPIEVTSGMEQPEESGQPAIPDYDQPDVVEYERRAEA